jgi:hypothetical protein
MSSNQNISTKICIYGCGLNLYWNTSTNEYWEVFTKKKHICPNRVTNKPTTATTTATSRPTYYNKKPWTSQQQPKPRMSNSFELLTGPIETVQEKYEFYLISCQNIMARFMVAKGIEILRPVLLTC